MRDERIDLGIRTDSAGRAPGRRRPVSLRAWVLSAIGVMTTIGGAIVAMELRAPGPATPPSIEPASDLPPLTPGTLAKLGTGDPWEGKPELAVDLEAKEALDDAGLLADAGRYLVARKALEDDGKVFSVPNRSPVVILEARGLTVRVQVESGEHAGETGWIYAPWVKAR